MPEYLTADQLKQTLDEKLDQKLIPLNLKVSELSTNLEDAMQFIDLANSKYEEVITKLNSHEIARIEIQEENKILKSALQQTESQLLQLKNSYNVLEQYSRREYVEIQGIPAPDHPTKESTNDIVMKIARKFMDIDITEEDISVSHRLLVNKGYKGNRIEPAIIVKFVRRDTKVAFYRARSKFKNKTTRDLGYQAANGIYINESLTEMNKALSKCCLKTKKDLNYKYIWTSNGRIYLRKNDDSQRIYIKKEGQLTKLLS
jgi:hypothetical protein